MALELLAPSHYAIGVLQPVAGKDAQGNDILSEIKAGSLVAYTSSSPAVAAVTPDPANPLRFKVQAAAAGQTSISAAGVNDAGSTINFSDVVTVDAGGPVQPPLATGFTVVYGPSTDPAVTPAPF